MWVRGPNITRAGALKVAANAEAFPVEAWYNTGDVCTITEQDVVAVVGRTKEMIK
jgi:long-subunit acyl-CoA synthetase (AMP-forming)